jgi:hypothetical protein
VSLANAETLTCPYCGAQKTADVFYSVNADRRPDLRQAAIDRTFQTVVCDSCGETYRIEPEFNYLDVGRGQWISVHAFTRIGNWETILPGDQSAFDLSYGPDASAGARDIGNGLTVRVTFGWAGFREKLIAHDSGLNDVDLELLKIAVIRQQDNPLLSDTVEMRLVAHTNGDLVLCWIDGHTDSVRETMLVPIREYETIAADSEGWASLRTRLQESPFVDMQRLMI